MTRWTELLKVDVFGCFGKSRSLLDLLAVQCHQINVFLVFEAVFNLLDVAFHRSVDDFTRL